MRYHLLTDDVDNALTRHLIIAYKCVKNILAYLLPIVLVDSVLVNFTYRHVSLWVTMNRDCQFTQRLGHTIAALLLEICIEIMIERHRSTSTFDGQEETSLIRSSGVSLTRSAHEKSIPQPVSDLILWTQLLEESTNVVVDQYNSLAGVREHKRLPFLRLLFKDGGKDSSTELEDTHQ